MKKKAETERKECIRNAAGFGYFLSCRRKYFVLPSEGRGFFERGRNRTVFFFAQPNRLLYAGFFEIAAQSVKQIELGPDLGRLLGALSGADNFERLKLLPFFLEDNDDIGRRTCTESEKQKFHRAGRGVGVAVGVHGHGMTGRPDRNESLFA